MQFYNYHLRLKPPFTAPLGVDEVNPHPFFQKGQSRGSAQQEQISMTMGRLKHIHLILILALSVFIPMTLASSLYVDLSGVVFLSSDMSKDSGDEDSSAYQSEFKVLVSASSSALFLPGAHFGSVSSLLLSSLPPDTQDRPVLRC